MLLVLALLVTDPALIEAAESLAELAAAEGDLASISHDDVVRLAVTRAGAMVSEPLSVAVIATDREAGMRRLRERMRELGRFDPTHEGIAGASREGREYLVGIVARTPVELRRPLPPSVPVGTLFHLEGRLLQGLEHPQVHVRVEGRDPVRMPVREEKEGFRVPLLLLSSGRTEVEVLGTGPSGPEVALLAHVYVGTPIPPLRRSKDEEGPPRDRRWVHARIDELRLARGLPPLRWDETLSRVAEDHAREMAARGRLAHRSERSGSVADRVRAAGRGFRRVAENLAEASSVEGAHRALLRSPAHLDALVDPNLTSIGIGIASRGGDGGQSFFVVEVLADP